MSRATMAGFAAVEMKPDLPTTFPDPVQEAAAPLT